MSFDSMIQQMGRAGRQIGQQAVLILMTPKWTLVKDEKEIQDRIAAYTDAANASSLLSDLNRPKTKGLKSSPLSCETNAEDLSDAESSASSDVDKNFDDSGTNQLFALFITDAKQESLAKKAKIGHQSLMQRNEPNCLTKSSITYTPLSVDGYSL